jgi:HSP20 family protein
LVPHFGGPRHTWLSDFISNELAEFPSMTTTTGSFSVDLIEKENEFTVHADLPGVKQSDIDISVDKDHLTLKAHRQHEYKSSDSYGGRRVERSYGSYSRTLRLPPNADSKTTRAHFENGVLEISFQKAPPETCTARKIDITAKPALHHK